MSIDIAYIYPPSNFIRANQGLIQQKKLNNKSTLYSPNKTETFSIEMLTELKNAGNKSFCYKKWIIVHDLIAKQECMHFICTVDSKTLLNAGIEGSSPYTINRFVTRLLATRSFSMRRYT